MLSRFKVRTKLLAIVLPLLVGLGVVSALGVSDRTQQRDAAQETATTLEAVGAGASVVEQLQLERLAAVSPAGTAVGEWSARIAATDQATARLWARLAPIAERDGAIGERTVKQVVRAYRRQLDAIAAARPSAPVSPNDARGPYTQYSTIIEALLDLNSSLVNVSGDIGGSSRSAQWIAASNEGDSRAAVGVMVLVQAGDKASEPPIAWVVPDVIEQHGAAMNYIEVFKKQASASDRATYDQTIREPAYLASINPFLALGTLQQGGTVQVPAEQWAQLAVDHQAGLRTFERSLLGNDFAAASATATALDREVRLFLGGALAATLLGLLIAAAVGRSMVSSVGRLTKAATSIANEQLPTLVEALRSSDGPIAIQLEPIDASGRDEFGDLAKAFNAVQQTATEVAAEQAATLRKGISDLFVNLARRNQSLLDRQIEFIDRLEANEEDPDQLENLFKLDHLATRMRRNAESLLVLAGSEAPRRRSKEVSITDVIRVAVGEVEDFARISLLAVDDAMALGSAAVDVAHLLSELMENGTQYSPPDRRVEVVGHRTKDGGYVISVSDQGVGMNPEQFRSANDTLARPPAVGLTLSRSLGFVVVATLASRHHIDVRLASSPAGGVTAMVTLPPALVVSLSTVEVPVDDVPVVSATDANPTVADFASTLDHPNGAVRVATSPFDYDSDPQPFADPAFTAPGTPYSGPEPAIPTGGTSEPMSFEPFPGIDDGVDVADNGAPEVYAHEEIPASPAPTELDDRVPMGEAFDRGLFALLDGENGGGFPGDGPHQDAPTTENDGLGGETTEPAGFDESSMGFGPLGDDTHTGVTNEAAQPTLGAPPVGGFDAPFGEPLTTEVATAPVAPAGHGGDHAPLRRVPVWSARPGPSPDAIPPAPTPVLHQPSPVLPSPAPVLPSPASPAAAFAPVASPLPQRVHQTNGDPWAPAPDEVEFGASAHPHDSELLASTPALPKRLPGGMAHFEATQAEAAATRIAAPGRAPDEVRSILSRYRSGLHSGRNDGAEHAPAGDVSGPTAHDHVPPPPADDLGSAHHDFPTEG